MEQDTLHYYFDLISKGIGLTAEEEQAPFVPSWTGIAIVAVTTVTGYVYCFRRQNLKNIINYLRKKPPCRWRTVANKEDDLTGKGAETLSHFSENEIPSFKDLRNVVTHYNSCEKQSPELSLNCKSFLSQQYSLSSEKSEFKSCQEDRRKIVGIRGKRSVFGKDSMMKRVVSGLSRENVQDEYQVTMYCRVRSSNSKRHLVTSDVGAKTTPLKIKKPDKYYRNRGALESLEKLQAKSFEKKSNQKTPAVENGEKTMEARGVDTAIENKRFKKANLDEMGEATFNIAESTSSVCKGKASRVETGNKIGKILRDIETEAKLTHSLLKIASGYIAGNTEEVQ